MIAQPRRIVVIDDNPSDIELLTTACEIAGITAEVSTFTEGRVALAQLAAAPAGSLPDTVMLDLNMPGFNGFDVLQQLKGSPALKDIRVLILTTSNSPKDRERCQRMGAQGYLVKPSTFSGLVELLKQELG